MILPRHPVWNERHHGGCATCHHWLAWDPSGAARCGAHGRLLVFALPKEGCASWQREPGADDEIKP